MSASIALMALLAVAAIVLAAHSLFGMALVAMAVMISIPVVR